MPARRFIALVLLEALFMLGANGVAAQDYPNKPIRIVTSPVGSSVDFVSRLLAQGISGPLGQPVIVDNRSVIISAEMAAKAPPDGYTLFTGGSAIWTMPLLQKTPYDPIKDYATITSIARSINVLVVHPSLPVKTVKELVALAKAKPGELSYASGGVGGPGHLAGELFKSMTGTNIVHVPYKGGAAALTDLMAGAVQLTFDNPATVMPFAKEGKLRALAVTSAESSPLVPELPTVAASLPGFEYVQMTGVFAPANTPGPVINRLNQEIIQALRKPDLREKYESRGIEVIYSTPEEFSAAIKSEMTRMAKVIKDAGIHVD